MSHRIIGIVLLVAYAMSGTLLMPSCISLLATLEGSHLVEVRESDQGTEVVLHHQEGHMTPRISDHPNAVARVLVSLSALDFHGDHSLVSGHLAGSATAEEGVSKSVVAVTPALNHAATSALVVLLPKPVSTISLPVVATHHSVQALRTVRLLI